ncbi:MAG: hypothetical protein ACTSWN_11450 [Promethearchaeota archaeon]
MDSKKFKKMIFASRVLLFVAITLIILAIFLPVGVLEYLSLNVVGGPPINGQTWKDGVIALGGEVSMRLLSIWGIIIIALSSIKLLNEKGFVLERKGVKSRDLVLFTLITLSFFIINLFIGYSWWDPEGILGMGPNFIPSILSIVFLGISPSVIERTFRLHENSNQFEKPRWMQHLLLMVLIALGYGLVSCIWHCCSFYEPKMYFFFFVIKLIQLWGLSRFFFGWALPKLRRYLGKDWIAYLIVGTLFGFCYPWHTIGFAITFIIFGFALCIIKRKTGSYWHCLVLLYFAYIFHAGLPWHGAYITIVVIHPISIVMIGLLAVFFIKLKKAK